MAYDQQQETNALVIPRDNIEFNIGTADGQRTDLHLIPTNTTNSSIEQTKRLYNTIDSLSQSLNKRIIIDGSSNQC